MFEESGQATGVVAWQVGALCRAIADHLQARFNPVTVQGELSGFARAASGHCYFSLKDVSGQLRCAMFKRAASGLSFTPRDGDRVEVSARLGVYEPRGELQLIVESMRQAGQGTLFEQFFKLKARLESEGLFDAAAKRPLPVMPRAIGVVTSLGAAALHDVLTALRRRAPHVPVLLVPASVQGASAPAELVQALSTLFLRAPAADRSGGPAAAGEFPPVDVILLVRGGGALEDLWAFNDERLARCLAQSPVPVVSGIGHETDFTIADFVVDLRAPTPTAAAELVVQPRDVGLTALDALERRLRESLQRQLDRQSQRIDVASSRLGRPSTRLAGQRLRVSGCAQALQASTRHLLLRQRQLVERTALLLPQALERGLQAQTLRLDRAALRLGLLDPQLALARGYAWLSDVQGQTISSCGQTHPGQLVRATLFDGTVELKVGGPKR